MTERIQPIDPPIDGDVTTAEAVAFWQSISPRDVAKLLDAAPKVAHAWTEEGDGLCWVRRAAGRVNHRCARMYAQTDDGTARYYVESSHGYPCESVEEALAGADNALRRKGWVLL